MNLARTFDVGRIDPLAPAIALMRRVRISVKFLLIALLFVVPVIMSAAIFERRLSADARRTEL